MKKNVWLAESTRHPGVYAQADYLAGQRELIRDPHKSMQFETKHECDDWCKQNPRPEFLPVKYSFKEEKEEED